MFRDTEAFKQLVSIYTAANADDPIGLYLGAGVNLPTSQDEKKLHFDTYSWDELLRTIYNRNVIQYHESFEKMKTRCKGDWPKLAEALVGKMSVEKLVDEIDLIFYHCLPREDKYGRLSKRMLDQAPTLHAAICFSACIKKTEKGKWGFERNPKISTVITPNYDFFFGAGWTRYQAFSKQWKVVTPFSSDPKPERGCIIYIHGYVPYRRSQRKELVLTRESYESAYNNENGFAYKKLEKAVREHNLIFIGTSFGDKPVNQILKNAKKKNYGKQYFVIEKSPTLKRLAFFKELGISPIIIEDYAEIATVLKELYFAGLDKSGWEKFELSNEAYWERLKVGPVKSPA